MIYKQKIDNCKTIEELKSIYGELKNTVDMKIYNKYISEKKSELQNQ